MFEIMLFQVLWPAQRVTGTDRIKISVKNQKNVQLLLELLEKWSPYKVRRNGFHFFYLIILLKLFSSGKIEKDGFWDYSTNFKHQ